MEILKLISSQFILDYIDFKNKSLEAEEYRDSLIRMFTKHLFKYLDSGEISDTYFPFINIPKEVLLTKEYNIKNFERSLLKDIVDASTNKIYAYDLAEKLYAFIVNRGFDPYAVRDAILFKGEDVALSDDLKDKRLFTQDKILEAKLAFYESLLGYKGLEEHINFIAVRDKVDNVYEIADILADEIRNYANDNDLTIDDKNLLYEVYKNVQ